MKELAIRVRLYNNRIRERREALGLSQHELARAAGMNMQGVCAFETLRLSPLARPHHKTPNAPRQWRKTALALAAFFDIAPEELFPESISAIARPVAESKADVADVAYALPVAAERLALSAGEQYDAAELKREISKALATLTPREEKVLRMRFGIGEKSDHTLAEVAQDFEATSERIRQIESKALRKLRHPSRSRMLRPYTPEDG